MAVSARPPSWYEATANARPEHPPLDRPVKADVCIVGAGYTGLGAALRLAERGVDVVVLEARRVGSGASGRNGGQLHSGQRRDQPWLEGRFGKDRARALWGVAEDAKLHVKDLINRHRIACDYRGGLIHAVHKRRYLDDERRSIEAMRRDYDYTALEWLDRATLAEALGTEVYHGGVRDRDAGHLHPLNFALGVAEAALAAGARIFEGSPAIAIDRKRGTTVRTPTGAVEADTVLIAGNGYLRGLEADLEARVMPINNYIVTTEPIGAGRAGGVLAAGDAAADSRFVVYYWRPTPDGRLLFGGGESYSQHFPDDIAAFVRPHLSRIYPALGAAKISHAWGGTLAVTVNRLPFIRKMAANVYAAAGFSGQGVAIAPYAGKVVADAILGDRTAFDLVADLPCPRFPGGGRLRAPLLVAAMTWFKLRDSL